jgi:hypothetical protein
MSPATLQRIDDLATDAVHDMTRAQVLAAGREYVQAKRNFPHTTPTFDRWLWDRAVERLTNDYQERAA